MVAYGIKPRARESLDMHAAEGAGGFVRAAQADDITNGRMSQAVGVHASMGVHLQGTRSPAHSPSLAIASSDGTKFLMPKHLNGQRNQSSLVGRRSLLGGRPATIGEYAT